MQSGGVAQEHGGFGGVAQEHGGFGGVAPGHGGFGGVAPGHGGFGGVAQDRGVANTSPTLTGFGGTFGIDSGSGPANASGTFQSQHVQQQGTMNGFGQDVPDSRAPLTGGPARELAGPAPMPAGFGQNYGQPFGGGPSMERHSPNLPMGQAGGGHQMTFGPSGNFGQSSMSAPPANASHGYGGQFPNGQPVQHGQFMEQPMGQPGGVNQMSFAPSGNFGQSGGQLFNIQPGLHGQFMQQPSEAPVVTEGPPCPCGVSSVSRTVRKEGPNLGRVFFCCVKPQGEQCGFFQFADEPPRANGGAPQQPQGGFPPAEAPVVTEGPPCPCGVPSVTRTVRKEGPNLGRMFFCCVKPQGEQCGFFQFADEPPRANGGMPQQPQGEGPPCPCGLPSLSLTTRKEGPNCGRVFYKCSKPQGEQCNHFQWADEPPRAEGQMQMPQQQVDGPPCLCGQPTAQRTARREGPNMGRCFFTCTKQQGEQCGYFQWADEAPRAPGPPCSCGMPSNSRTVAKEGPNKGRPFVSCATRKCTFFQWMDENNGQGQAGVPTPARGGQGAFAAGGGAGGDVCYKCNQPGHWASNCPNAAGQPDQQQRGGARSFGRDMSSETCFKCNMTGHWASNCPNEGSGGKGAGQKGYGKGVAQPGGFDGFPVGAQSDGARYQPF